MLALPVCTSFTHFGRSNLKRRSVTRQSCSHDFANFEILALLTCYREIFRYDFPEILQSGTTYLPQVTLFSHPRSRHGGLPIRESANRRVEAVARQCRRTNHSPRLGGRGYLGPVTERVELDMSIS